MQDDIANEYGFTQIYKIALDAHSRTVYLIGSFKPKNLNCLARINYDGTVFTSLFCDIGLSNPQALDAFNNTVFWVSQQNQKYVIYEAKLSLTADPHRITILHQTIQVNNSYT